MDLFYIRLFALQCLMSKNEKILDVPKILSVKKARKKGKEQREDFSINIIKEFAIQPNKTNIY
jgi:hypothetical protein